MDATQLLGLLVTEIVEQLGRADEIGEQEGHGRCRRGRRGDRDRRLAGRRLLFGTRAAQLFGQRSRGRRWRDPQLGAEPICIPVVRDERRRAIPGRREPGHERAVSLLAERVERDDPAGVGESGLQVAGVLRPGRELAEHAPDLLAPFVAGDEHPVVVETREEVPAP